MSKRVVFQIIQIGRRSFCLDFYYITTTNLRLIADPQYDFLIWFKLLLTYFSFSIILLSDIFITDVSTIMRVLSLAPCFLAFFLRIPLLSDLVILLLDRLERLRFFLALATNIEVAFL